MRRHRKPEDVHNVLSQQGRKPGVGWPEWSHEEKEPGYFLNDVTENWREREQIVPLLGQRV